MRKQIKYLIKKLLGIFTAILTKIETDPKLYNLKKSNTLLEFFRMVSGKNAQIETPNKELAPPKDKLTIILN